MDLVIGKPKIWHFASRGLGGLEVCAFPFFGVLALSSTEGHHHTVPTQPPARCHEHCGLGWDRPVFYRTLGLHCGMAVHFLIGKARPHLETQSKTMLHLGKHSFPSLSLSVSLPLSPRACLPILLVNWSVLYTVYCVPSSSATWCGAGSFTSSAAGAGREMRVRLGKHARAGAGADPPARLARLGGR